MLCIRELVFIAFVFLLCEKTNWRVYRMKPLTVIPLLRGKHQSCLSRRWAGVGGGLTQITVPQIMQKCIIFIYDGNMPGCNPSYPQKFHIYLIYY